MLDFWFRTGLHMFVCMAKTQITSAGNAFGFGWDGGRMAYRSLSIELETMYISMSKMFLFGGCPGSPTMF